ncbi:S1/P1 nuclease [Nibrella saemangeumensis]|uniref:S1/P1 nuclease n=1 Tax=Nibrella saemangeumensis TaxID=1084526 RepID=A0ABP8N544_9BACT
MKARLMYKLCWLGLLVLCLPIQSYGWNRAGHMVTGSVAYRQLKASSRKDLVQVLSILRQHPEYQSRWAPRLNDRNLSEDERDEYLFMLAARWPDDIRSINRYHHSTWHYINYYYAPEQGIARTDTILPSGETILQAYDQNLSVLSGHAPDSTKAIALCWIFHLVGDIHMPLHTVAMVTSQYPKGDQGGNLVRIKVKPDGQTIGLHGFWDDLVQHSDDFRSASQTAIKISHAVSKRDRRRSRRGQMGDWAKDSFRLAVEKAYRNGTIRGSTDPNNGTLLPADYITTTEPVAERQAALAGLRLAKVLKTAV